MAVIMGQWDLMPLQEMLVMRTIMEEENIIMIKTTMGIGEYLMNLFFNIWLKNLTAIGFRSLNFRGSKARQKTRPDRYRIL